MTAAGLVALVFDITSDIVTRSPEAASATSAGAPDAGDKEAPAMTRPSGIASRFVRAEIKEALAHGATLGAIERDIVDCAAVSDDARAALWLFAWGASERRDRGLPTQPLGVGRASHLAERC